VILLETPVKSLFYKQMQIGREKKDILYENLAKSATDLKSKLTSLEHSV